MIATAVFSAVRAVVAGGADRILRLLAKADLASLCRVHPPA
jgi:hypothetical protein